MSSGAFPALPENRAVVLRIEPLRVSPLRAFIPRPKKVFKTEIKIQ